MLGESHNGTDPDCAHSQRATKLSSKARGSAHGEDSPYFEGWNEFDKDPYHPLTNPSGVIQMGLAENQLSIDLIEDWLKDHPEACLNFDENAGNRSMFKEMALYQNYHGLERFKKAMAGFMEVARGNRVKFDANRIVLTAGATAANELLMFCLADPGDAFLVPTPYYPGFVRDLRWRTGVEIVPVHCESKNNFEVNVEAVESAYVDATSKGVTIRGLMITNPSNPLGTTLSPAKLRSIVEFSRRKGIHVVCDEIYSGSVFGSTEFHSIAETVAEHAPHSDNVHIVYSLSKDLGLPGFRVGAIYSTNDMVVRTATRMSSFCMVSSQTQHMLSAVLSDGEFTRRYMQENHRRLRERQGMIVIGLTQLGIDCVPSNAALFCWVDMRPLLRFNDADGEKELWKAILHDARLNVSPGSSFQCMEPGWFRLCFANMTPQTLRVSLLRLRLLVLRRKAPPLTSSITKTATILPAYPLQSTTLQHQLCSV